MEFETIHIVYLAITGKLTASTFFCPNFTSKKEFFCISVLSVFFFYNTGIATYIWVLSKNKRPERKGKIQLIDASGFFKKLRKALGDKKNEISPEDRTAITKLYADFVENEYCKIYDILPYIFIRQNRTCGKSY